MLALVLTLILSILIEPIYGLETSKEDITERLIEMSNELTQYTKELERIEEELEARIEYVERLNQEAEQAESVLKLSETQLNAIHAMLSEELRLELRLNDEKDFWPNIISNAFFCVLGIVLTKIIDKVILVQDRTKTKKKEDVEDEIEKGQKI